MNGNGMGGGERPLGGISGMPPLPGLDGGAQRPMPAPPSFGSAGGASGRARNIPAPPLEHAGLLETVRTWKEGVPKTIDNNQKVILKWVAIQITDADTNAILDEWDVDEESSPEEVARRAANKVRNYVTAAQKTYDMTFNVYCYFRHNETRLESRQVFPISDRAPIQNATYGSPFQSPPLRELHKPESQLALQQRTLLQQQQLYMGATTQVMQILSDRLNQAENQLFRCNQDKQNVEVRRVELMKQEAAMEEKRVREEMFNNLITEATKRALDFGPYALAKIFGALAPKKETTPFSEQVLISQRAMVRSLQARGITKGEDVVAALRNEGWTDGEIQSFIEVMQEIQVRDQEERFETRAKEGLFGRSQEATALPAGVGSVQEAPQAQPQATGKRTEGSLSEEQKKEAAVAVVKTIIQALRAKGVTSPAMLAMLLKDQPGVSREMIDAAFEIANG